MLWLLAITSVLAKKKTKKHLPRINLGNGHAYVVVINLIRYLCDRSSLAVNQTNLQYDY